MELLLSGNLNEYLHEVEEECYKMEDILIEQMKRAHGVTEQLKKQNQMLWVRKMNNIRSSVEEVILTQLVYS